MIWDLETLMWHHCNKVPVLDLGVNGGQHYGYVIMSAMASQITSLTTVYSTALSGADQRKHHSSASLAFVRGIHRWQRASNAENVSIWWRHLGPNYALQWPHHELNDVSSHRRQDCLLKRLLRRSSKKTPKLRITRHSPPMTGGFSSQRASNTENVSI